MNEKRATATRPAAMTVDSGVNRGPSRSGTITSKQTACPWESGQLGNDIRFARAAPESVSKAVDEALGLVEVCTRVSKKQGRQMERAAAEAGLCLKAWLRKALVKGLAPGKKKTKKNSKKK